MRSIDKFCVMFPFLDLQKLSEDRLDDLCEFYSNSDENNLQYFNFLKCNLNLIHEINKRKKILENKNDEQINKMNVLESKIESLQKQFSDSEIIINQLKVQLNDSKKLNIEQQDETKELKTKVKFLQKQFNDSKEINSQLQVQLNGSKELNNEQQIKMKELENQVSQLQKQFNDSKEINSQLQVQLNGSKELNNEQQIKMKELENQVSQLQKQLDKIFLIKGQISAKVENGLFISAEINLKEKNSPLDTSKSKFIFSTSCEKSLGIEAYEKGEQITSLNMKTASYMCRPGTYFVRCIVFNSRGGSNEIVSNSVTTSGSCATFGYTGEKSKISLYRGKYKLEVWGAKGGDSTGNSESNTSWARCKHYFHSCNRLFKEVWAVIHEEF